LISHIKRVSQKLLTAPLMCQTTSVVPFSHLLVNTHFKASKSY